MTTWDVRTSTGQPVTTLAGLAKVLGTTQQIAAKHLLADADLTAAAPADLLTEAKAKSKPGGDTPPPIANGSFVAWNGGKGRVDLIVTKGTVPGVEDDVEGTGKSPAARVVVWENGKPTRKKIAASTHTLRRIPPLDRAEQKSADDPARSLVAMSNYHETMCTSLDYPEHARLTGVAIKTAYDRGLDSWPGYADTACDRVEWALGRAEHLMKVAAGEVEEKEAGHDRDLLHEDHPYALVRMTVNDLDPTVRALMGR